jgi:hypothetical protein
LLGQRATFVVFTRRLTLALLLWGLSSVAPAFACRFTVWETGFVDLGYEPYRLFGYVEDGTAAGVNSIFAEAAQEGLAESNIQFELVNAGSQKEHPGMEYVDSLKIESFPAAVLVSPDGQALQVAVKRPNGSLKEGIRSVIEEVLRSPKREEILKRVCETYGVVLLIEGPDAQENKRARDAAVAAVEQVTGQMEFLPKPIAHGPVLVAVDANSLGDERVLLWSLALGGEEIKEPCAAIIYGRARWIGPLFRGEQITEDNLLAVLFVIGDTCECGIDRRWLQGTMLPASWDRGLQAKAAESLGFDPENPMVKMEIASIMGRGGYSYAGVPFGYQELVIESEPNAQLEQTVPVGGEAVLSAPDGAKRASENPPPAEMYSSLRAMAFVAIGITAVVVIVGIVILLRPRRI